MRRRYEARPDVCSVISRRYGGTIAWMRVAFVICLTACGRYGFDARGDGHGTSDTSATFDGMPVFDAPGACIEAVAPASCSTTTSRVTALATSTAHMCAIRDTGLTCWLQRIRSARLLHGSAEHRCWRSITVRSSTSAQLAAPARHRPAGTAVDAAPGVLRNLTTTAGRIRPRRCHRRGSPRRGTSRSLRCRRRR
jgi:hypothetical protein